MSGSRMITWAGAVALAGGALTAATWTSTAAANAPHQRQAEPGSAAASFMIISNMNRFCLDIRASNTGVGAGLNMQPCTGNANQLWHWDGSRLVSNLNAKCLDINDNNGASGAGVNMWDCHDGPAQKWRWSGTQLANANNNCLTIPSQNGGRGAAVAMWACNGDPGQQWS
ncbi:RICIN domain-containing protein [Spirillospora sp. NBC_00431]